MAFRYRHGDRPLEGYTILRGLGQGGFGEVYYARSDGGREVALKIIQQNHEIELRGVRQCMNLKSPYLVTIFDVHQDTDGYPFVVMEHIRGPSLRAVAQGAPGGLELAKAAYLLREIGKGLSYLHEHGIVHRDLKPENIFYEDGFVKIGDYGLSKYISVSHQSGQTISVGSVHYMAPEIGSGNYQCGIDIYALGVIFYELLTGTVPFNGDSMGEILMKHLSCEPDVSGIPAALRPVVQKALAKRPEDRYASVQEFVDAILSADGVGSTLDGFDPESVTSSTSHTPPSLVSAAPEVASATQETRRPEDLAPAARPAPVEPVSPITAAPAVAAVAAQAEPMRPEPEQERTDPGERPREKVRLFRREDLDQRLFISFITTLAMGLSVWLLAGDSVRVPVGAVLLIAAGVLPILFVEGFIAPRFRLEGGLTRSVATFVFGAVPITAAFAAVGRYTSPLPLLAALLLVDWTSRLDPRRAERVSLSQALTAGLFGFVAALATRTNAVAASGILAAMSLVLNAFAPFVPPQRKHKRQREAPSAPPPVEKAPPPAEPAAPPAPRPLGNAAAPAGERPAPVAAAEVTPPSRLVRTRDAMIAGVCGGLAARYAVDVAWVRLAFFVFVFITAGWALPAYVAMWICMPKADSLRKTPAKPPREPGPRPMGSMARVLHALVACGSMACGVPMIVTSVAYFLDHRHRHQDEHAALFGAGAFLVLFACFAFIKGRSRHRLPFWRGTFQPIFVLALLSVAGAFTIFASLGHLPDEPFAIAVGLASISGVLATMNGFGWFRWHRKQLLPSLAHASGGVLRPYQPHAGWFAMSAVLLAIAFAVLVFGTLLSVGASAPIETPFGFFPVGHDFDESELVAARFALFFFLPGLFCLVMARRPGGGAHVLRGAIGAILAGLLSLLLVTLLRESYHDETLHHVRFLGETWQNMEFLILLLITGAASTVLLAWPARAVPHLEDPLLAQGKGAAV